MENEKFVFFYGGPFSQWAPFGFELDGVKYATAEQYMMAMKAEYFGDEETKAKIMATSNPSEQKALGRMVANFDKEAWDAVSRGYVYKGNIAKFTSDEFLTRYILDTGEKEIVEASPYDKIWGIGLSTIDERRFDKKQWRGTNWLGETLMKVRTDLRKKQNGNDKTPT
jgi:ribA/ribD-fused uncharacterized protein